MARYIVYSTERMYQGLHGMFDITVVELNNDEEASRYGEEMSYGVMESYSSIIDALEDSIQEIIEAEEPHRVWFDDEIAELREDIYAENVEFTWAIVDENLAGSYTTQELDSMAYELGYEEFRDLYCSWEM